MNKVIWGVFCLGILAILALSCKSGSNHESNSNYEQKKFSREDIFGTWYLRVLKDSPWYIHLLSKQEGDSTNDLLLEVIKFFPDGICDIDIGLRGFIGKWEIENNRLVIHYKINETSEACEKHGLNVVTSVSLDGFSLNNGVKEGMVDLLYQPRTRIDYCEILPISIYQK